MKPRYADRMTRSLVLVLLSSRVAVAAPSLVPDVSFSFNHQSEGDRRTPARYELPAGQRLVLRVWLTWNSGQVADPDPGYVTARLRDASGRLVLDQVLGDPPTLRPSGGDEGGARNFLIVALRRCHGFTAGSYTLDLLYRSPGAPSVRPLDLMARTNLVLTPAPPMPKQHLAIEIHDVGISEDQTRAVSQLIVHNDGCEPVTCSMVPADGLQVTALDGAGKPLCRPAAKPSANTPRPQLATIQPGDSLGLGLGFSPCDAEAVRRAGGPPALRGHVRYDSRALPGWPMVIDAQTRVVQALEPR